MCKEKFILLSFDVEEFDLPLEYDQLISEEEQMNVGYQGLEALMNIIDRSPVKATFFTTANFARHHKPAIRNIASNHEIASHSFYHSSFSKEDLANSKVLLESITGKKISGLRMPRMLKVDMNDVKQAGYLYDSSVNPTYLPGRYNNWHLSRTIYKEAGVIRVPASVTPNLRIPLFWLTFKNFPYNMYLRMVKTTLTKDGYVCLYFHPWEFTSLASYKIPGYIKRKAGKKMVKRLTRLIEDLQALGTFISMDAYLKKPALNADAILSLN